MMNTQGHLKFAIYSRKSKFSEKGDSVENQVELCRKYIESHYGSSEDQILVFEDEGFSGGNVRRPQFQALMEAGRAGRLKAVVCYRLDRVSRNIGDFSKLIEELSSLDIDFISIKERFDTSSPLGRAMMYIASVFSQLERETIAERIRDNLNELAKTGRWLGGATPTGYQSVQIVERITSDGKTKKAFRLQTVAAEAELVREIFNSFLNTKSLTRMEAQLKERHQLTKRGRPFTRFAIKGILRNPVYMIADGDAWDYFQKAGVEVYAPESEFNGQFGVMAYNKTLQASGKATRMRDMNEWVVAVGKHTGLIPGEDWVRAQELLNQNNPKKFSKPRSHVALLSGLLYCGECGNRMRPKLSGRLNAEGRRIYSYLCETKEKSCCQDCGMKNPNGNRLDAAVRREIRKLSGDVSSFLERLQMAEQKLQSKSKEPLIQALQKEWQENERKIAALVAALAQAEETPAATYITQRINELHQDRLKIDSRMQSLQNRADTDTQSESVRALLNTFATAFDQLDIEQTRTAFRVLIQKVVWDGDNVHVYLPGSYDQQEEPQRADSQ